LGNGRGAVVLYGLFKLILWHVGDAHSLQLLMLGQAGFLGSFALRLNRTAGALGFGPIAAPTVELLQLVPSAR
jgi:hypothetical protein